MKKKTGTQNILNIKSFKKCYLPIILKMIEFLFISVLILGIVTFALNNTTLNYITALILSFSCKCLLLGSLILFLILSCKSIFRNVTNYKKGGFENLKKEINTSFPLIVSKKGFFFSLISFLFAFILLYYTVFRLAVVFFFFGCFFLFREMPFVKNWLYNLQQQDNLITEKFQNNYSKIYKFNWLCKWFCFIYFIYFCIFRLNSGVFLDTETIDSTLNNIIQLLEPLYLILLVFINSVLMDLFLEFITIYSDDFLFATIPNLVRRASKAVVLGGVGGGGIAAGISYSPLVDLPGVNESQIRWGRGFGYKTPLDWAKGTIIYSYIELPVMQSMAEKYGNEKVFDGNSYQNMLTNEPKIKDHLLKKATPWEQRALGLRKY
jgi:hypothetical protein